ncbi:MAG: phosphate signaling complex protein PhoU [Chloroflexi bacterium]|nr:phosphate signaling complex protein PhoU [Chloroflexota bacterium]
MSEVRATFDRALRELQDDVLVLGSMVDKAVDRSMQALKRLDHDEASRIIHDDLAVNQKRFDIEQKAIQLIATQQPIARDLRTIVAVLNIVIELERIGDYAEGIAKIVHLHGDQPLVKSLGDIPLMADEVRGMLRRALDAFINRDAALAVQVANEDDAIDELYDRTYRDLLDTMLKDPRTIDRATWLLWVAHNLERTADRITNICERVVYEVTGTMTEMNVSKY